MIYLCYLMNCSKQTEMFMIIIHEAPTSYIKDTIEQIMDDSLYHPKGIEKWNETPEKNRKKHLQETFSKEKYKNT